ncbi:hypothetical protein AS592_08105 [Sulfurovum riftiae]|uniref:Cytochrome c-552/4 domain-containing protein n=2 Tax=Sulfurovum riftiae TaxID=1630136 RepID=A0A151CHB6_9BACT|nr:hypothetical protein AS592_08105 [Sulfurovum riftiae]
MVFLQIFILFISIFSFSQAKYLDNHSCNECHEKIYEEYQTSHHAKGYFNDTLHRKIADKVSTKKYECATCHMPMADNIDDLISGKARPDKANKTHTDAISCYFCHTIAYVKNAHKFNVNTKARQAKNYKPTLYGRLSNPDDSDKHSSASNPVYAKKVCMGCHSHKLNDNNVTIFRAMDKKQDSEGCIKCHMPEIAGGAEKMDKRARGWHASHKFLGIHDEAFRKTGMDINITVKGKKLKIKLTNKMEHPLIIQPARVKFLKITVKRGDKVIWSNYTKEAEEDKQGYFAYSFQQKGHPVIIPATATDGSANNIAAKESRILEYEVPVLQTGDVVTVGLYVQFAKNACTKVISLEESNLTDEVLMKEVKIVLP